MIIHTGTPFQMAAARPQPEAAKPARVEVEDQVSLGSHPMPLPSWKSSALQAGAGGVLGALVASATGHSPAVGALFGSAAGTLASAVTTSEALADGPAGTRWKGAFLGATVGAVAGACAVVPSHFALIGPAVALGIGGNALGEGRGAIAGGVAGLALTPVVWSAIANSNSWTPAFVAIGALAAAGAVLGAAGGPAVSRKLSST